MSTVKGWGPPVALKWGEPDPRNLEEKVRQYNALSPKEKIALQLSTQNTAIQNLRETVAQQSATINKLQEVILELKTMITNISG